jgi:DNA-binding MarR family transcriptional regulator
LTKATRKQALIGELVELFRANGNQDSAFDHLAARRLGVNDTDLHCLNIIENSGGLTAGGLAARAGLTTGAVTGVIDRLERVGYARRVSDPADRRRVKVEVTAKFYGRAGKIWGPMRSDWDETLSARFSAEQLEQAAEFLRATNEIAERHLERLRRTRGSGGS